MTKVSRIQVDPDHMGWFINSFWNSFTLLDDKNKIKIFLKDLLTHTELKMLAKRLQIAKMLQEGHDYLTIKSYVKVTDQTVSRVNNILHTQGEGYREAIYELSRLEESIRKKWESSGSPGDLSKYPSVKLINEFSELLEKGLKKRNRRLSVYKAIKSS